MEAPTREILLAALNRFTDPVFELPLDKAGMFQSVVPEGDTLVIKLMLGFAAERYGASLANSLGRFLADELGQALRVEVDWQVKPQKVQAALSPLPGISNVIAIASAKGGVGKSTTAANFALALAREGAKIGMLDADIYGPSQPRMLGIRGQPATRDGKQLLPMENHGIKCMSIGFLVDESQPMVWRGPMVTQALNQLLAETDWGELDYLVVDMPPGTGDIQLTLSQRVPLSGVVIVTTPQDISLLDARRGVNMFRKVEVEVLGIVENMSQHVCGQCGHVEPIFGDGGGQRLADEHNVILLGALPLDIRIREQADGGIPTVVAQPDSELAQAYTETALRGVAMLAHPVTGSVAAFPEIEITDD